MLEMLWRLFISFSGRSVQLWAVPLTADPQQVVDINKWLRMDEFADLVTISQMTRPVRINAATFTGTRMAGGRGDCRHLVM